MLPLYRAATAMLTPAGQAWSAVARRDEERLEEARQRLGQDLPCSSRPPLWLHGASMGEAGIIIALAEAWRGRCPDRPLVASAMSRSGRDRLRDLAAPSFFMPLDIARFQRRAFTSLQPGVLSLVETELWPNLLSEARRRGVPTVLINARLSPNRMNRYRKLRGLYRPLVEGLAHIGARTDADAERFASLGARPATISVTGDVKFDIEPLQLDRARGREAVGLGDDQVLWVVGSLRAGEENAVVEAVARLTSVVDSPLRVVVASRHLDRIPALEQSFAARELSVKRWPTSPVSDGPMATWPRREIRIVDRLGVLRDIYAIGDVAFVGGTLTPIGGHNVLEPAAAGLPLIVGPHTFGIDDALTPLLDAGAARQVGDADGLAAEIARALDDPTSRRQAGARGRAVVNRHRGAVRRSVELLIDIAAMTDCA